MAFGISLSATITAAASMTATVPLGPPLKGAPIILPIGPGIPIVPSMNAEASVQFTFRVSETVTTSALLTIRTSISSGYSRDTGFFYNYNLSPTHSITPPNTATSCSWSIDASVRPAIELSLFAFYPSLSLGPSAGVRLQVVSAPEKAQSALSLSPLVSSAYSLGSSHSPIVFLDVNGTSYIDSLSLEPSPVRGNDFQANGECNYCGSVPVGENPGYVTAQLLGVASKWNLELAVLPWLSQSWNLGQEYNLPWWSSCFTVASSRCDSCCGPPTPSTFLGQLPTSYPGNPLVNFWAQYQLCSAFWWLLSSPGRYCILFSPQPTPGLPDGGCWFIMVMEECISELEFNFTPYFEHAGGGNSQGYWSCNVTCEIGRASCRERV